MPTSACSSPGKAEGRTRKNPLQEKKQTTQKGGAPAQPQTRARRQKKGRGGKRQSHNCEAAHPLHKRRATPAAMQHQRRHHGAPERRREDRPAQPSNTQSPAAAHHGQTTAKGPEEGTPRTRRRISGWRSGGPPAKKRKKQTQPKRKGKGGRRSRVPGPQQAPANTTKPQDDRAGNHTPPPRSPKKRRRSGEKPHPRQPLHNPTPQAAPPEGDRKETGRTQEATRPNTPTRKSELQEKTKPKHTHHEPHPGMAEHSRNPYPGTRTLNPSQEWRGYRRSQPQTRAPGTPAGNGGAKPKPEPKHTHPGPQLGIAESPRNPDPTQTPHNNRKPGVHSPGGEAARVMQVTRPNEIRSPGVRLHPKACAPLGLQAERATPKHLRTRVPRTCMHALGTACARKSSEPLGFRPKEGTCASTGAHPPGETST